MRDRKFPVTTSTSNGKRGILVGLRPDPAEFEALRAASLVSGVPMAHLALEALREWFVRNEIAVQYPKAENPDQAVLPFEGAA